ncbi:hypothetical protein ONS95_004007 [Cadophora gregata]|uniref:uncharacterized protein n=1 Tax=Cadophora gregata TaxID=51156 RepID=UPI0026DCBF37|nr:uncharacterized protein ONS95_004007 [Cadophora gregata]KAK0107311.1 hypothetical protein ONS95_004007 [Cadophora gregata]KAK0116994.1 hypothetical protein ONS96_012835 [Cadophora gregata f. sp. sojae]
MSITTPDDNDARKKELEELTKSEKIKSLPGLGMAEVNTDLPATTFGEATEPVAKSPSPPIEPPSKKLCGVCNEKDYKYKCSRCYLPYCSIACSTIHKATHPAEEPKPTVELKAHPTLPPKPPVARPGTIAGATNASNAATANPFAALDESKELKELFTRFPRLQLLLDRINKATLPPVHSIQQSLNGNRRKEQPWNSDRGLEKGVKVLDDLRNTGSKDGRAIREFSKLILRLLSPENGLSAREVVEQELAAENQKVVEQLLNGEL